MFSNQKVKVLDTFRWDKFHYIRQQKKVQIPESGHMISMAEPNVLDPVPWTLTRSVLDLIQPIIQNENPPAFGNT